MQKMNLQNLLGEDYVEFKLEKFIENPVALARIKAGLTQEELAERLGVSQAYISKIENQLKIPLKLIEKISRLDKK
jgi:DNA-binding XRE family transcriptional regulator